MALNMAALRPDPVDWSQLSRLGDRFLAARDLKRQRAIEAEDRARALQAENSADFSFIPDMLYGNQAGSQTGGRLSDLGSYYANVRSAESGGRADARNPNSTATGLYQFTDGTWNDVANRHPQLGLTPDGRTDPRQQEMAMRAFTSDNAQALNRAGTKLTPGTLYAAHFLGSGAAPKVYQAPDNAPMSALVSPQAIEANPFLGQMNAGQFKQWAEAKATGQGGGSQAQAQAPQQASIMPDRAKMAAALKNPVTRPAALALAQALYKARLDPQKSDLPAAVQEYEYARANGFEGDLLDYQTAKRGKGTMLRVDPETGEVMFSQGDVAGSFGGRDQKVLGRETAKADAAMLKDEREAARAAEGFNSLANQLEDVIGRVGYTGPGGDIFGKIDDAIKVLPGDEGARGAFRSLAMEAQLAMTQKTKGAITDREMGWFREAVPNLSQTPEGNRQIIGVMRGAARRIQTRAAFMERFLARNGSLSNAQAAWSRFINDNPLIERGENGFMVRDAADFTPYLDPGFEGRGGNATEQPAALPEGVTEEDIQHTMQVHGLTREQVLERISR